MKVHFVIRCKECGTVWDEHTKKWGLCPVCGERLRGIEELVIDGEERELWKLFDELKARETSA